MSSDSGLCEFPVPRAGLRGKTWPVTVVGTQLGEAHPQKPHLLLTAGQQGEAFLPPKNSKYFTTCTPWGCFPLPVGHRFTLKADASIWQDGTGSCTPAHPSKPPH